MLMDLTVDGERVPALIQNTKQGLVFAFNRETGEPIWPIEDREVIRTEVPGNYTSPRQPYPTRPEPVDRIVLNGLTEEFVIDYTPELKQEALAILEHYRVGGLYVPGAAGESHQRLLQQRRLPRRRQRHSAPAGRRPEHRDDVQLASPELQRAHRSCGRPAASTRTTRSTRGPVPGAQRPIRRPPPARRSPRGCRAASAGPPPSRSPSSP